MDKASVLITGFRGIVGSIIMPRLQVMGFLVEGYDLKDGDDILDTHKLTERLRGKDVCVHLAGIPGPWAVPWENFQIQNVEGTDSVIKACKKAEVKRLIYMSSGDIYGLCHRSCKPTQFPIRENNPLPKKEDVCFYSFSKRKCENHLKEAADKNFTTIALRLETPHPPATIIPSHFFISISHDNLAEAVRAAIEADFKGYGAFNIADPMIPSSVTFDIYAWLKREYSDVPNHTKPGESLLDISRAKKLLGYKPTS